MTNFVTIRTMFLPESELISKSLALAKEVTKGQEIYFHITKKTQLAHSTIYMAEFPLKNFNRIVDSLARLANKTRPIKLEYEKMYQEWGYIGFSFKKNREIYELHKQVLDLLNPLRDGHLRMKYIKELRSGKYSKRQMKYIRNFGYPQVLSEYNPHLTLARLKSEEKAKSIANEYNNSKFKVKDAFFKKIAIGESGEHGTCTKIIKEFELKG